MSPARNVSYRFVENPLGDQSRCAFKRANRHPRLGALPLAMLIKLPKRHADQNSPSEPPEATSMPFPTFKDTVKFRSLDTCTMHVTPPTKTSRLSNHPPCSTAHGHLGSFGRRLW